MPQVTLREILLDIASAIPDQEKRESLIKKIASFSSKPQREEQTYTVSKSEGKKPPLYGIDLLLEDKDSLMIELDKSSNQRNRIAAYCCGYAKKKGNIFVFKVNALSSGIQITRINLAVK